MYAGLKNTIIVAMIALISIVCSFIYVIKMSPPLVDNDFELQDTNSISTVVRARDIQQGDKIVTMENEKGETENSNMAGSQSNDKNDTNDDGEDGESGGVYDEIVVPMDSIVVNLGGIDSNRYIRAQITLGVDNENAQNMINEKAIIIRDLLISFFSRKTVKAMETEGGLFKLRQEIKDEINKVLGPGDITKKVYFSDLIVQ